MATSNVAIANLALQKLGAKRIESLTQDHANARSVNACFVHFRRWLLRKYTWSFAISRDSIAADATGAEWGDWDRYTKPEDFLRLIRDDESGQAVGWKIEGDYILSADGSPLEIRYIADITDANLYDELFVEALAAKIAEHCCEEITGSTQKKASATKDFDTAIAEAERIGAMEKDAEEFPEDEWITARR